MGDSPKEEKQTTTAFSGTSMYQSLTISNYFIQKLHETGHPVTAMKLIKLVYIAHGWYLALNEGKSLINEAIQAWKYGPVIHSLYHKLKKYYQHDILSIDFPTSEGIDKEAWIKFFLTRYGRFTELMTGCNSLPQPINPEPLGIPLMPKASPRIKKEKNLFKSQIMLFRNTMRQN